ncbi:ArgE/DapE family deacylase [Halorhodospira neutriphila]|uniref:Probable succinyl-diaminopimelate desuccinylase n=1 Tax=Halorhodospira neutriphila TaxID=168379 RepID=A0ABS1E5M8_9GAMM|nr:ArgE/DapE family deacylase [Halorhodospira neutriphila]MBK1726815.1 acetylornithine deacetylase [Halorhodospira neutriphila]
MARRTSYIDEERIRERLVSLIRIPSITGEEDAAVAQIADWLQQLDAEIDYWHDGITALQRDPRYPGHEVERAWAPVVVGVVRGEQPGPSVLLTGHVDVVPPGDYALWDDEPFSGMTRGDRIVGCGASDMKSGLIAALAAFEAFAEGGRHFPGRVIFAAVPAEEDSGLGTLAAIRGNWRADACIIPEPTVRDGVPELVIAHAGAISFHLRVPGKAAHASKRLQGESALDHFLTLYKAMRADERAVNEREPHPLMRQHELPYATNVGILRGGLWSSSVMDSLEAHVRIGVALGETVEAAEARFRRAIAEAVRDDPWLSRHPPQITRQASGFGSAQTDPEHPLVAALAEAAEEELRAAPRIAAAPYGCDMSGWVRLAGVPTVVYGPGDIDQAHAPNESASLETTYRVARTLVRTTERLLETDLDTLRLHNGGVLAAERG